MTSSDVLRLVCLKMRLRDSGQRMRGSSALTLFLDGHCTELYIQTTQRCHKDQKCLASSYNIVLMERHCSLFCGRWWLLLMLFWT